METDDTTAIHENPGSQISEFPHLDSSKCHIRRIAHIHREKAYHSGGDSTIMYLHQKLPVEYKLSVFCCAINVSIWSRQIVTACDNCSSTFPHRILYGFELYQKCFTCMNHHYGEKLLLALLHNTISAARVGESQVPMQQQGDRQ